MNENAERVNGLAAMLGIIAAMGAYATTGQIIPWHLVIFCFCLKTKVSTFAHHWYNVVGLM